MAFERMGLRPLDYRPVRYDGSKLEFRGPQRTLSGDFIACLGGTETYGTFIDRPYPDLMERSLGLSCVNFGWPNAGVDAFLKDEGLLRMVSRGRAVVLQVPGAMNLSNPFYKVHPRRNDRFLEATPRLRRLYPEVDFTEFHFTRHMMRRLEDISTDRFAVLREGLQEVWVERMQVLLQEIDAPVILMWFSRHAPGLGYQSSGVADDPAFVSRAMLRAVGGGAAHVVEVVISDEACAQGTRGMRFGAMQESVAADLPGLLAHSEASRAVSPILEALLAQ
ncbi:DUF6473 family protein [Roseovarius sp. BRH_c41]|uniref:DUF6473 family protein n=1 Tax=Roseovarius sp. BRH_c41 TaxID=1629709 RepID=UPI0005F1668A|nr:DUF6473 family protein [Roseovarius sp. BRH_c41]KJS41356.1 MAG: hypothetical protein VR71_19725 [Roseovarius sp. BRH_c41]KJS44551.1 MAG: hypothetical protein VR71_06440 [Roseovarius sp. BRH_c41]